MKCKGCGFKNSRKAQFCKGCGKELKKAKKWQIVAIACVSSLILLILIMCIIVRGMTHQNTLDDTSNVEINLTIDPIDTTVLVPNIKMSGNRKSRCPSSLD